MATAVLFRSGEELCALTRESVRQIAPLPALSRPPTTPPALAGFMNLAGEAIPVLQAARLFGVESPADPLYAHVLVLQAGEGLVGLLVERVTDVREVDLSALRREPAGASLNGCIEGDFDVDGEEAHLLAPARLLLAAEQAALADLRAAEQARLDAWRSA